ncbi:MAG: hypothetical protein QNK04_04020 [Myxococcota bacterium]|nr:hypothetical protein [Myxococcota bacterium]
MEAEAGARRERRGLLLVVALHLALGLGYSVLMPVWEAPDEQAHYRYALHVARHGERPPLAENHEAFQPIPYYALASLPLRLLDRIDAGLVDFYAPPKRTDYRGWAWNDENYRFLLGPLVLRWASLGLSATALSAIYAAARRLAAPSREAALATLALAGLVVGILVLGLGAVSMWTLTAVAGLGLASALRLLARRPALGTRRGWAVVWATIGLALLAVLRNFRATPATQGRFLFPALGAISLAACAGWLLLLPSPAARRLPEVLLAGMVLVNLHFWLTEVIPFYHQPLLD